MFVLCANPTKPTPCARFSIFIRLLFLLPQKLLEMHFFRFRIYNFEFGCDRKKLLYLSNSGCFYIVSCNKLKSDNLFKFLRKIMWASALPVIPPQSKGSVLIGVSCGSLYCLFLSSVPPTRIIPCLPIQHRLNTIGINKQQPAIPAVFIRFRGVEYFVAKFFNPKQEIPEN